MRLHTHSTTLITINNLKELLAALDEVDIGPNTVVTTPDSAIFYMGLEYINKMVEIASQQYEFVYDIFLLNVQDDAAICVRALKTKFKHIIFTGSEETAAKLNKIAQQHNSKWIYTEKSRI